MPASRRTILLSLALILLALGILLSALAAIRLRDARAGGATRELFVFERLDARESRYAGRPLTLTDERDAAGESVRVRYGDAEFVLRPSVPPGPESLPGLVRHESWMQVLRFAPRRGLSLRELQRKIDAGEIADRLAVVTRTLRPGADPATWGEVWHKDWTFDFHEIKPDGTIAHERLKYPGNRSGRPAGEGELVQGTWQFDAALMVMPKGAVPKAQFREDGWKAMGWMLPVSMACLLAFVLLVIAAYSSRAANLGAGAAGPNA